MEQYKKVNRQLRDAVLEMQAEGRGNKDIADELLLSYHPSILVEHLLGVINHLDSELTDAYEEAAGESL